MWLLIITIYSNIWVAIFMNNRVVNYWITIITVSEKWLLRLSQYMSREYCSNFKCWVLELFFGGWVLSNSCKYEYFSRIVKERLQVWINSEILFFQKKKKISRNIKFCDWIMQMIQKLVIQFKKSGSSLCTRKSWAKKANFLKTARNIWMQNSWNTFACSFVFFFSLQMDLRTWL